jgi:multidrug efflux pump subunit AcrA (membrane-fusion protein)
MRIRKKKILTSLFTIIFMSLAIITPSRFVYGDGEGEQLGGEEKGTASTTESAGVELSDIAQKSIGLKVVEADMMQIEEVLSVNGIVRAEPNRVAEVSTRAEGRIQELYANLGDRVKRGQKLAAFLPRQIGDPPLVSITAPLSGTIVERNLSFGGSVEPNATLFRIADLTEVIVEGDVFESDVSKVRLGQHARVRLDAYPDMVFDGSVSFIADQIDPEKRTLRIWVSIDNKEELLKPEFFAKVDLVVKPGSEVLAVPVEAIIDAGAEKFVFVKNGNEFVRQDVATGMSDDRYIEITDGLYTGDQVVTDGNRQIYTKWLFSR